MTRGTGGKKARLAWFPRTRRGWLRLLSLLAGFAAFVLMGGHLMIGMPGESYRGPLPPLTEDEVVLGDRLKQHIRVLAVEIGPRHVGLPEKLKATEHYIANSLRDMKYPLRFQECEVRDRIFRNVEAEKKGVSRPEEIVIVGAHYDTVPYSPGANDNGTGIAAVLEMARSFSSENPQRTVRFVAFVNEEPPFFHTEKMGSLIYARRCREAGDDIVAMLTPETIGYYSDEEGSQMYPFPLHLFYPDTGNFVGFVGNLGSISLVRRCVRSFRGQTKFPSEGAALPGFVPGVDWSDHWSFWEAGYPALMVTDTAPFRYRYYHTPEDTPDKIDFDRLARVVAGLTRVVRELAGGDGR
jgi:hypothetical protein